MSLPPLLAFILLALEGLVVVVFLFLRKEGTLNSASLISCLRETRERHFAIGHLQIR